MVSQNVINTAFALGKGKNGKFELGEWVNQALFSVDGSNRRLATKKEKTKWKNFSESVLVSSDTALKIGSVYYLVEDEAPVTYTVICRAASENGNFNYYVGK